MKRMIFYLGPFLKRTLTSISSEYRSAWHLPQFLQSRTGDHVLSHILERCIFRPDFKTATSIHGKIIKHGYGTDTPFLTMLIKVFIACENIDAALEIFNEMIILNLDVVSTNVLINSFVNVGQINTAKKIYSSSPSRDVVSWNSMIGGLVKNGLYLEAIGMLEEMLAAKIEPNSFTFASLLTTCSRLGAITYGKWVHDLMTQKKVEMNYILYSALVDMYARCGKIETAKSIFKSAERSEVSIYNSMINGLAIHGLAPDSMAVFSIMEAENILPDHRTFLGILTACSHCGFVEEGREYFAAMKRDYSIQPQLEHYGAMVDLLARGGLLEEAFGTINDMPMEPDVVIWRSLLSACRTHRNWELAEEIVSKIKNLDSGDYALWSNVNCSANKWERAEKIRHTMNKKRAGNKDCGKSWFVDESNGGMICHYFKAGDQSNPEIYGVLEALICRVRMEGHQYSQDLVLMDISGEEKEENLKYHSDKLALAFGVLRSSPGAELFICKNLRTCLDCHSWIKIVSKVLHRVITVRDRIRFHRFENGFCSCGDYW